MNSFLKKAMLIAFACVFMISGALHAIAIDESSEIMPYYVNVGGCDADFFVQNGFASVDVMYEGHPSKFTKAEIAVKIQKRFLLVIWNDVGEWTATSTNLNGNFSKSFAVNSTGYYRALITVKIYGTSGEVDTIEFTKEYKYD